MGQIRVENPVQGRVRSGWATTRPGTLKLRVVVSGDTCTLGFRRNIIELPSPVERVDHRCRRTPSTEPGYPITRHRQTSASLGTSQGPCWDHTWPVSRCTIVGRRWMRVQGEVNR